MSIEMYDRAAVIERNGVKHYLVKHGSKNTFTVGRRTGNDFRTQYPQREVRDSSWRVVARGNGYMSNTSWNAPTGWIYGRIMFGNKRNIALYLDKVKPINYETLDEHQKNNVDVILNWYVGKDSVIDLENIKKEQVVRVIHEYCGKEYRLPDYRVTFEGRDYWDLDNL